MMKKGLLSELIFIILIPLSIIAGDVSEADSLELLLLKSEGRSRIIILNQLAYHYSGTDPGKCIAYGKEAVELSSKSNYKNLNAEALEYIGRGYFSAGDFKEATRYLIQSHSLYIETGDKLKAAKTLQNIGLAYLMTSDFIQAKNYLLQAEIQYTEANNRDQLAYCLANLGLVSYYTGDYASALEYYEKASGIYQQINLPSEYAELLNRIAMTYRSLGINDKALQYMLSYIKLLKTDYPKAIAIGYNNIGAIYKDLNNWEKALEYYREAVIFYQRAGDSLDLPSPLNNIGTIYASWGNNDSALFFYGQALAISESMGDKLQSAKTKHNLALIYSDIGKPGDARRLLIEFLQISREIGYKEGIAQATLSLGNLARDMNDPRAANGYYRDCIAIADSLKLAQVLMTAHLKLSELLLDENLSREAFDHYKIYTQIKDTLFNKDRARIITELETRYETEKKQQENELLIKDNELKNRRIKTLYIIIAAFFILMMGIIVLIIQYRKITIGKKLLAESEAARLSEKVDYQKQELAGGALALSRNLSFISKLLTDLKSLSSHVNDSGTQNLMSIIRNIQHLDTDPAWSEFEMRFQKVHARFYDQLTNEFPTLTTNEMRLCALIKLGMNTKEISTVTFQNIRAIEAARLRLRKKLGLEGSEDLGAFLQKI